MMDFRLEVEDAICSIWSTAPEEKRQEALNLESEVLGYEADEDKVIADLTGYFTDCVNCDVVDGVIVVDKESPAYTDIGSEITSIDQLIDCIG